jgi:hypothetical protein
MCMRELPMGKNGREPPRMPWGKLGRAFFATCSAGCDGPEVVSAGASVELSTCKGCAGGGADAEGGPEGANVDMKPGGGPAFASVEPEEMQLLAIGGITVNVLSRITSMSMRLCWPVMVVMCPSFSRSVVSESMTPLIRLSARSACWLMASSRCITFASLDIGKAKAIGWAKADSVDRHSQGDDVAADGPLQIQCVGGSPVVHRDHPESGPGLRNRNLRELLGLGWCVFRATYSDRARPLGLDATDKF